MFAIKGLTTLVLALSLCTSALAGASQRHNGRDMQVQRRHQALPAHAVNKTAVAGNTRRRVSRRAESRRCKPRPSSSSIAEALPTSSSVEAPVVPTPTPEVVSSSVWEEPSSVWKAPEQPTPAAEEKVWQTEIKAEWTPAPTPEPVANAPQGGGGASNGGKGTFYSTGLGSCGMTNKDDDFIAAVSFDLFNSFPGFDGVNPNNNPICGKTATVWYGDKTITVQLVDKCEACAFWDLDFSPKAFAALSDPGAGRIDIKWALNL